MRTGDDDGDGPERVSEPVLLAAGVADLVFDRVGGALRGARSLLGRSDLPELAADGREELRRRGQLALRRYVSVPECHMELLARRAADRTGRSDD
ncbi:hypothetical protein ACFWTE_03990 [Nocardiopsis sp. NPDC058631]|uniref:hypothetical protein n=1 Tax=Nocardiopsis sp. NPDC058631 TaxID=3346566 RepID=UPI0036663B1B